MGGPPQCRSAGCALVRCRVSGAPAALGLPRVWAQDNFGSARGPVCCMPCTPTHARPAMPPRTHTLPLPPLRSARAMVPAGPPSGAALSSTGLVRRRTGGGGTAGLGRLRWVVRRRGAARVPARPAPPQLPPNTPPTPSPRPPRQLLDGGVPRPLGRVLARGCVRGGDRRDDGLLFGRVGWRGRGPLGGGGGGGGGVGGWGAAGVPGRARRFAHSQVEGVGARPAGQARAGVCPRGRRSGRVPASRPCPAWPAPSLVHTRRPAPQHGTGGCYGCGQYYWNNGQSSCPPVRGAVGRGAEERGPPRLPPPPPTPPPLDRPRQCTIYDGNNCISLYNAPGGFDGQCESECGLEGVVGRALGRRSGRGAWPPARARTLHLYLHTPFAPPPDTSCPNCFYFDPSYGEPIWRLIGAGGGGCLGGEGTGTGANGGEQQVLMTARPAPAATTRRPVLPFRRQLCGGASVLKGLA